MKIEVTLTMRGLGEYGVFVVGKQQVLGGAFDHTKEVFTISSPCRNEAHAIDVRDRLVALDLQSPIDIAYALFSMAGGTK